MELVTGKKGSPHITSQQERMKHQGTWGDGAYILQIGQMLEPQVQSSNEIRIRDGALMVQGALGCVKVNTYDPVTIQNGTQGMKRIDLICWQYTYDAEQDVESAEWVVIQGTPAESDPQQPAYTDGDIQQGDSPVQVPVFAVELDGINVTGVTTLLPTAPTLEELNSNSIIDIGKNIDGPNKTTYNFVKYANGLLEVWGDAVFDATTSAAQTRVVEFPSVDFLSVDDMQVLLTANRNSTIITGLYESNGGGNITRTTHSFMARCTKTTGNYSIGFSFFVKGWWK